MDHGAWLLSPRDCPNDAVPFVPEILLSTGTKSDKLLMEETSHLASLITPSVDVLTSSDALQQLLARYPEASESLGQVLVSAKRGREVSQPFSGLEGDLTSYSKTRETCSINYDLLKKGDPDETRFVVGRIIMDTMNDRTHFPALDVDGNNVSNAVSK